MRSIDVTAGTRSGGVSMHVGDVGESGARGDVAKGKGGGERERERRNNGKEHKVATATGAGRSD